MAMALSAASSAGFHGPSSLDSQYLDSIVSSLSSEREQSRESHTSSTFARFRQY